MDRRLLAIVAILSFMFGMLPTETSGQQVSDSDDLSRKVEALQTEVATLRKELDEVLAIPQIRGLIEENRPIDAVLNVADAPFLGDEKAVLTLVEFSDFQCPYCARHVQATYPVLKDQYVAAGKLKYVFFDFPLQNHANAPKAAEAARCAGEQGKFWEMHDHLFANQSQLVPSQLRGHADSLGLDAVAFTECLDSGKHAEGIRNDMTEGVRLKVRGTPSFGLGYTSEDGTSVHVVDLIRGAQPLGRFQESIDNLLAERGSQ